MDEFDALMHRMSNNLFESASEIVGEMQARGDDKAWTKAGSIMLTIGALVLIKEIGREGASTVAEALRDKIDKGELDVNENLFGRFRQ